MYIDIGLNLFVRDASVVGVFDLDNTTCSKWTRKFLSDAEQAGEITTATDELPKSFLVTREYGLQRVYLTQYNAAVLVRRLEES